MMPGRDVRDGDEVKLRGRWWRLHGMGQEDPASARLASGTARNGDPADLEIHASLDYLVIRPDTARGVARTKVY